MAGREKPASAGPSKAVPAPDFVRFKARGLFLHAVKKRAPNVLDALADLLPLYQETIYRGEPLIEYFDVLEECARQGREIAIRLLAAIRAWSQGSNLAERWIEERALGLLVCWSEDAEALGERRIVFRLRSPSRVRGRLANERIEWSPPPPVTFPTSLSLPRIEGFHPDYETPAAATERFLKVVLSTAKMAAARNIDANRESYASHVPRSTVRKVPKHLDRDAEWTVRVHVLGQRYSEFRHDGGVELSREAASSAVRTFAALVGLRLQPRAGRPKKSAVEIAE